MDTVEGLGLAHLFGGRACSGTVKKRANLHVNVKTRKKRKRRITKPTVNQTYGGFRRSHLNTVAGWSWRIFLWEKVVQGRSKTRQLARQCERLKKAKKRRITESAVTPAHSVLRSSNLNTVADWGWRIFLCEEVVQGRSKNVRGAFERSGKPGSPPLHNPSNSTPQKCRYGSRNYRFHCHLQFFLLGMQKIPTESGGGIKLTGGKACSAYSPATLWR